MLNIELLQRKIDDTKYWDMSILDIQTQYFNDEVYIFIENDEETCWKICFLSCYKVSYETDANWRMIDNVKKMQRGQLGYDGQDISLKKYEENENFVERFLDLSIMTINIVCKDIQVKKLNMEENRFFWHEKST